VASAARRLQRATPFQRGHGRIEIRAVDVAERLQIEEARRVVALANTNDVVRWIGSNARPCRA
jgi:hypothetical protein